MSSDASEELVSEIGKLLAVDDNELLLRSTVRLIESRGLSCVGTSDPQKAIQLVEKGEFSVALLDLSMPEISGLELGKILLEKKPDLRCFILTGAANKEIIETAHQIGFEDVLFKPISVDELFGRIQNA